MKKKYFLIGAQAVSLPERDGANRRLFFDNPNVKGCFRAMRSGRLAACAPGESVSFKLLKSFLILPLLFFIGCNNTPTKVQQNTNADTNVPAQKPDELSTVSSHSQDKKDGQSPDANVVNKSGGKTKWTQSGNPIDTTSFDTEIKQVEDKIKSNPKDETLKKSLADAYVARGMALTDARQYASALGDYRKALKLDPANETAKQWIEQIIGIYESINRSYPPEGEEPPPLPFKKES